MNSFLTQPFFFKPNLVWRLYKGGLLLSRFKNEENEEDNHFPEEWLASTVVAQNGEHMQSKYEGLSQLNEQFKNLNVNYFSDLLFNYGEELLGNRYYEKYGPNLAILCKFLDSAIRLPIQCHPDEAVAQKLYNSPFGKTECWHIISTRKISGIKPYILLGFKKDIKAEDFKKAVFEQNVNKMFNMLHKIEVKVGETYFVPARMPHAIGPGVFMLEVQEPSDWVIQPEQYCSDFKLSETDMWGQLTPKQGLEVFDYTGLTINELLMKVSPTNSIIKKTEKYEIKELIGPKHTNSFNLWEAKLIDDTKINLPSYAIIIIKQGEGYIHWQSNSYKINKSDYFFVPENLNNLIFKTDKYMELLICLPPILK